MLTAVMYHYVRDLPHTRFPAIKGLMPADFDAQLDYLCANYEPLRPQDLLSVLRGAAELPSRCFLLTFDDGLIEHFTEVFPRLVERGLNGIFFVSAQPLRTGHPLYVHKLHFVLAAVPCHGDLLRHVLDEVRRVDPAQARTAAGLVADAAGNRWDAMDTAVLKRLLQRDLPRRLRQEILDRLFAEFVGVPDDVFSHELYMDLRQIRMMHAAGMVIGGHGDHHDWLGAASVAEQEQEIAATVAFLTQATGNPGHDWMMAYPYGSYAPSTVRLLSAAGCAAAFTTVSATITAAAAPLELPRLDTNEVPRGRPGHESPVGHSRGDLP